MKQSDVKRCVERALELYDKAGICLTDAEKSRVEVADFGLGRVDQIGLELLTYVNTSRVCAKEMVLFPGQTCPEHWHVPTEGLPGKEETFRCRYGEVELYVPGDGAAPEAPDTVVTVFHQIKLLPGEQFTILPGVKHWFRGGRDGAVVSEFSTHSTDETDVFTDPAIVRAPTVEDD